MGGGRWRAGADFGDEGAAQGENDVAVLVSVLKNGIALVAFELPAGRGEDLVVAVEGGVAGNKIETRIARIITNISLRCWLVDFDGEGPAETGAAVAQCG